jgi:uncharacterized protein
MPQEDVEIIRRLYRAMDARDFAAVAELAHPDVEWIPDTRVGEEPARGLENVVRFFLDRAEMFDELHAEPERFWQTNDKVLVFIRVTGTGQTSGAPVDIHIAHLWTLEGGVVVRGEGFGDRDKALEAAGLRE